jgi:nicotinamide phosphoribosyltransferase
MKATWCRINGEFKEIFKSPKTDSGMKKSLRGLITVVKEDGKYVAYDCAQPADEVSGELKTVFEDGKLIKEFSLQEVRDNVRKTI